MELQHPEISTNFLSLSFHPKYQIPVSKARENQTPPRINVIIATRYDPLVLPQNLHDVPQNYVKHLPSYNGEGEVTTEEHLVAYYNFENKINIEHEDVWMRIFAKSLEGEFKSV
jgi:hypothetical protein